MREARVRFHFYGVETGSRRMQRVIHKGLKNVRERSASVKSSCELGMTTVASMIVGYPEGSAKTCGATLGVYQQSLRHVNADPRLHLLAPLARRRLYHRHGEELVRKCIAISQPAKPALAGRGGARPDPIRTCSPNFYSLPTRPAWSEDTFRSCRKMLLLFAPSAGLRWLLVASRQPVKAILLALFDDWKW